MGEFQEKVEELKNTMQHHGFSPSEELDADPSVIDDVAQEQPMEEEVHQKISERSERRSQKKRDTLKHQLDYARHESKLKDAQNQELLIRLQEKERLLSEKQYQVEEAVNNDHTRYVDSLGLREQSILNELKVAKEEGDIQKEIEMTQAMAQVVAEKSTYGLYKSQIHNQPRQNDGYQEEIDYSPQHYMTQAPYQEPYQEHDEPENEHLETWLEKNQWADPSSANYSQRLRGEVGEFASELDERLKYNGRADMIGTPEYYDALDNLMKDKYSTSQERPQQNSGYSGGSMVAPVSRSGSSMSDQYVSRNPNSTRGGMALTREEYAIARNLQIPMPNGRMRSAAEAIELYKEGKRHNKSNDPLHPNRLTIE